jgi:hypothetical protein
MGRHSDCERGPKPEGGREGATEVLARFNMLVDVAVRRAGCGGVGRHQKAHTGTIERCGGPESVRCHSAFRCLLPTCPTPGPARRTPGRHTRRSSSHLTPTPEGRLHTSHPWRRGRERTTTPPTTRRERAPKDEGFHLVLLLRGFCVRSSALARSPLMCLRRGKPWNGGRDGRGVGVTGACRRRREGECEYINAPEKLTNTGSLDESIISAKFIGYHSRISVEGRQVC